MRSIDRVCDCYKREYVSLVVADSARTAPCPVGGCGNTIELAPAKKKAKKKTKASNKTETQEG